VIYNSIGGMLSVVKLPFRLPDCYTCIEFAAYALGEKNIRNIRELELLLDPFVAYRGEYKRYVAALSRREERMKDYFSPMGQLEIGRDTAAHFYTLLKRTGRKISRVRVVNAPFSTLCARAITTRPTRVSREFQIF
jgi:hypothetical protein